MSAQKKKKEKTRISGLVRKNELEYAVLKKYNSNNNIFKQRVTFSVQVLYALCNVYLM